MRGFVRLADHRYHGHKGRHLFGRQREPAILGRPIQFDRSPLVRIKRIEPVSALHDGENALPSLSVALSAFDAPLTNHMRSDK